MISDSGLQPTGLQYTVLIATTALTPFGTWARDIFVKS